MQFVSEKIEEVDETFGFELTHATLKRARMFGIMERWHATLQGTPKIMTGARRTLWHISFLIVVLNYNTSTHSKCEPSRRLHGH